MDVLDVSDEAQWADIPGYDNYAVSDQGEVLSIPKGLILSPSIGTGYARVNLWKDGLQKSFLIHRLVADGFMKGYDYKKAVVFRNGDMLDCRLENLIQGHKRASNVV